MTEQHRATAQAWEAQKSWALDDDDSSCILELRDRVAALEAAQRPTGKEWIVQCDGIQYGPTVPAADSAASLVERVARKIQCCADPSMYRHEARAAIREVAAWLRIRTDGYASDLLDEEVDKWSEREARG